MKNNVKRTLIYGITNQWLRKRSEIYLSDDCEIVGYSDSYYGEDVLQGERFIFPQQIVDYDIDVVIACVRRDDSYCEIKKVLADSGFDGRVLHARKYFDSVPLYVPNLREEVYGKNWDANKPFRGAILGLSYSYRGIDCEKLEGDFYDFSWHGLDLYYNKMLFEDAMRQWKNPFIDIWLIVMPYYYFDYDMSKSEYSYKSGQINSVRDYGWHNGEAFSESIDEYIVGDRLFGNKLYNVCKGKKQRWGIDLSIMEKGEPLDKIWYRDYKETTEENIALLKELLNREGGVIIIPPFYLRDMSEDEWTAFIKKKDKFYSILADLSISVPVYDCVDLYDERTFFADSTHLNYTGRTAFTKYINKNIL